ncbi:serine/threonine-protein kinase pim-1-like [Menidia menidia]
MSSSVDSGTRSTNSPVCSTSEGDTRVHLKRKAVDPEETQRRKRVKTSVTIENKKHEEKAAFEAKYVEESPLGEGGCGCVFAGYRKADKMPVAIKHIPKDKVYCKHKDTDGRLLSVEVAVMQKLGMSDPGSVGSSAPVSLLDWYDFQQELILVLERPMPAEDLSNYIEKNGGSLEEEEAKVILKQLVDAAIHLKEKSIFHRDIKVENILIETSTDVPRVRLIDFGLSCFVKTKSRYRVFYGTSAHVPPEWLNSHSYTAGPTTVWQMGVVLFETLHNKEFKSTRFVSKRLRISNRLSQDCQDFLEQCLTHHPEQRPTLEELQHHPWFTRNRHDI